MAEYGEWNCKGATLSEKTAKAEYGVDRNFIIKGINAGKLEYRHAVVWGNPYIRVLRSQLEVYIAEVYGEKSLKSKKSKLELQKIDEEISDIEKRLIELRIRKVELENALKK